MQDQASLPTIKPVRAARGMLLVGALAILLTFLNALKPLHVDDTYYHYYAAHIASHPADPFGFQVFWWEKPVAASRVLAPPVFPYWWAIAIKLTGDDERMWKWWLLGVNWLFVFSLHALLGRFTGRFAAVLLPMTVLSPVFLPSVNMMIDVPALALGLSALVLFMTAVDRNRAWLVLGAGLLAGLAMQTKYTAFVVPGAILAYGLVHARQKQGLTAATVAAVVFAAWEVITVFLYGESSFLCNLHQQDRNPTKYLHLALPLLSLMGGVAPALALFGLAALGATRRVLIAGLIGVAAAFCSVLLIPETYATLTKHMTVTHAALGGLGVLWAGSGFAVGYRLLRPRGQWLLPGEGPDEWFLVLWFLLELAGYFVLSPFAAVRRVMGIYIVGMLVAGRLAERMSNQERRPKLIGMIAASGLALGCFYYGIDLCEARVQRLTAQALARRGRNETTGVSGWFLGSWGVQYYGERAGLRQVVPEQSRLCAGDWLAVPGDEWSHQHIRLIDAPVQKIDEITIPGRLPLRTLACYYGGRIPLQHHDGPWMRITIYRVERDFTPRRDEKTRNWWTPPGAG
jgi:4-amino-4-deoxy-L-arabinose transferase-like glycosyltransferase